MRNFLVGLLIILTGCMDNSVQSQPFEGNFSGQQSGINSSVSIKEDGLHLNGSFTLNGNPGNLTATSSGTNFEGNLFDIQMQKNYAFTGYVKDDSLYMDIVFPELNNQVIKLQMKRNAKPEASENTNLSFKEKNQALVGLWRYTETFSSGSGDNYASLSTDYFMDFKADGTVYSWTGKSAGGTNNVTLEGYPSGTQKGGWRTVNKTLFLKDLTNGQESSLLFYANDDNLMFHNGGDEKKIMTRINN